MSKFEERLKKDQKKLIRYIYWVLVLSFAFGGLAYFLTRNTFGSIFFGIGFFFLCLLLVNRYSTARYRKEACAVVNDWKKRGKRYE